MHDYQWHARRCRTFPLNLNSALAQTPFDYYRKPKQPADWYQAISRNRAIPSPPQNSLFAYFQDENGQMDWDKMLKTAGKMADTFQQVTPMLWEFSSKLKHVKQLTETDDNR